MKSEFRPVGLRTWIRAEVLLALVWLFHATNSLLWLWRDGRFPSADALPHLTRALRVADVLAQPGLDWFSRLAAATGGQPPLPYVLAAPFIWLFGTGPDAVVLANLLLLAVLLASTYGIGRTLLPPGSGGGLAAQDTHWPALLGAVLLSFYPLVFLQTRVYSPSMTTTTLVSVAIWLLLRSQGLQYRRHAVTFGLVAACAVLASPASWAAIAGPALLVAARALAVPRVHLARRRSPSRNAWEWINRRLRLAPAHWNLLLAALLPLSGLIWYLAFPGGRPAFLSPGGAGTLTAALSRLDDSLGGFFLVLLIIGVTLALWQLLPLPRAALAPHRTAAGIALSWLVLGTLGGVLVMGNDTLGTLMLVLPAAALLSVWWSTYRLPLRRAGAPFARSLAIAAGLLVTGVALVNFLVISWGAPGFLSQATRAMDSADQAPLSGDTPLLSPDRAIIHQYPPRSSSWIAVAAVQMIAQDCLLPDGCDVVVTACSAGLDQPALAYAAATAGYDQLLRFDRLDSGPGFYRALLDAHYLVGEPVARQCADRFGATGDGQALLANLRELEAVMAGSAIFADRFRPLADLTSPAGDLQGWLMRREGPTLEQLDDVAYVSMLEHILAVTPEDGLVRQELSRVFDRIGDLAQAVRLREEAVAQRPDDPAAHAGLGHLYLDAGRTLDALEQFQRALELSPPSPEAQLDIQLGMADAYERLGQWDQAQTAYTQAAQLAPNDYEARLRQGLFYIGRNRFADATAALLVARRVNPDRPEAYLAMAQAQLLRDDLASAEVMFRQAREAAPQSPEPLLAWARGLQARGDLEGALDLYAQAVEVAPDQVAVYQAWIQALQAAGRNDRALDLARSLAQTFPQSPVALQTLADLQRLLGQPQEALDQYRLALDLAPDDVGLRLALGDLLVQLAEPDEALAVYRAGLELPAGQAELLTAVADLRAAQGDTDAAVAGYRRALEANPAYWLAADHLGRLYLAQERPNMALQVSQQAAALTPEVYQMALLEGDASKRLGRLEEAAAAFRGAVALAPQEAGSAFLQSRLGEVQFLLRNYSAAQESFQKALRLNPRQADAYVGLGNLDLALGLQSGTDAQGQAQDQSRFARALEGFRTALQFDPQSLAARIGLGDLYAAYGQPERAIGYYQEALTLGPDQEAVRQKLFDLYLAGGQASQVLDFYTQLLQDNPQDATVLAALVEAYLDLDRVEEALAAIRDFLQLRPGDEDVLALQADTLVAVGRLQEALVIRQGLAARAPEDPMPLIGQADILGAQGQLVEAEASYRQALQLIDLSPSGVSGNRFLAYTGLARLLLRQGRTAEALQIAQSASAQRPEVVSTFLVLGDAYRVLGNSTDALLAFQEAARLAPNNGLALSRVGDVLVERGQLAEAQAAFEAAVAAEPRRREGLVGLAKVLSRLPDSDPSTLAEAEQLLRVVLAQDPQDRSAQLILAEILLAQGQPVQAVEAFQTALAQDPEDATAFLGLGRALLAAGNVEEALASYQEAVDAAPDGTVRENRQLALAATYRSLGRDQEAAQVYQAMLQANGSNVAARIALGDLFLQAGDATAATRQYRLGLELEPDNARAAAQLGRAYLSLGDLTQAEATAQAILAQRPDAFQAFVLAALVAEAKGDQPAALGAYRQAAALAPDNVSLQTQLADALLAAGRRGEAAQVYDTALAIDPTYPEALVGLARLYAREGALRDAEDALRQALAVEPDNVAALSSLGAVLLEQGLAAEAIDPLEAVISQRPDHPTAPGDLANAYLAVGRVEEGTALLESLLGSSTEALLASAQALAEAGQQDQAIAAYQRYLDGNPQDYQARLRLAGTYRSFGLADQALQVYQEIIQARPDWPDVYVRQGDLLLALNRAEQAAHSYEAAVAIVEQTPELVTPEDSQAWQAWFGLARSESLLGRREEALAVAQAIQRLRPDLSQVALLIGDINRDLGRWEEALLAYGRAAELAPTAPLAQSRRGDIYLRQGQLPEAEAAYEAALGLDAADSEALEGLGRVYAQYGAGASPTAFLRAESRLRQSLKLSPNNAGALVALGDLYLAYGNPSEALAQYQAALAARPDHPTAQGKLADALLADGQVDAAVAQRLQILEQSPDDVATLIALAQIYRLQGRYQEAVESYRQAIQASPDNQALPIALGDLFLAQDQVQEAITLYQGVIAEVEGLDGDAALAILGQAQDQLGKAYLRLGQTQEALKVARGLIESQPDLYRGYLLLGDILTAQGELEQARSAFEGGATRLPSATILVLRLADLDLRMGQAAEAQTLYETVVDQAPREVAAYVGLARSHMAQASDLQVLRYEWADTALQAALRLDPQSIPALITLGDLQLARSQPSLAIRSYQGALANQPLDSDTGLLRSKLAAAYLASGRSGQALQEYQRVAVANPTDLSFQMALGTAYRQAGRPMMALDHFRRVRDVDPTFPFAFIKEGEVLDELGQGEEALAAYMAAVAAAPESADAHFTLASAYRARGQFEQAIAALQAGLAIDPDREGPQRALQELLSTTGSDG